MRAPLGAVCLALFALPLHAEIYRCVDDAGSTRFTSDPGACDHAVEYTPRALLQPVVPKASDPALPAEPASPGDLRLVDLFADPPGASFEVLDEPPETAVVDPELRALGLRASQSRHYTRARGPVSEVCTVEIWAFDRADQAARAARVFEREGWHRVAVGDLLVLAHGVRLERNVGSREGLVEGCVELAEATRARAAQRSGE